MLLLLAASALAVTPVKAVRATLVALQNARPDCAIAHVPDALAFTVTCGEEPPLTLYLDRLVEICRSSARDCRDYRANLVEGFVAHEQDTPLSLDHVVPAMRTHAYVEEAANMLSKDDAHALLTTPYGRELELVWMFDMPRSMRPLVDADLATLQVDRSALEAAAKQNCGQVFKVTDRVDRGDFHVIAGAEYTACALFADVDALANGGAPVTWAAMPTASMVIFTTDTSPQAASSLEALSAAIAKEAPATDRRLGATVLRRTATGWEALGS